MDITIRDTREDEFEDVEELVVEVYSQYETMLPDHTWKLWSDSIGETIFSGNGEIIVAEMDGEIVGGIQFFYDVTSLTLIQWPKGAATVRILSVRADVQGKGIGRMLMDECIRRAKLRDNSAFYVVTTGHMLAAKRLYERMGFKPYDDFDGSAFSPEEMIEAYRLPL